MERPIELCPHCEADLIGDEIPEDIRQHYSPPYYWKRKIGIYDLWEDRTVAWKCPDCGGEWERIGYE